MDNDVTTIKASASASFFQFLRFHSSYSHSVSDSDITKYKQSSIDSKVNKGVDRPLYISTQKETQYPLVHIKLF